MGIATHIKADPLKSDELLWDFYVFCVKILFVRVQKMLIENFGIFEILF